MNWTELRPGSLIVAGDGTVLMVISIMVYGTPPVEVTVTATRGDETQTRHVRVLRRPTTRALVRVDQAPALAAASAIGTVIP